MSARTLKKVNSAILQTAMGYGNELTRRKENR